MNQPKSTAPGHLERAPRRFVPAGRVRLAVLLLFMLSIATGSWPASSVQAQGRPEGSAPFSIGYLPEGSDLPAPELNLEELRGYLLGTEAVARELERAGYAGIILSACDGPRDMVQRISIGEFDLVFATAVVYARAELGSGDAASLAYEPILQTTLPGDLDSPRPQGAMRRGVLIAGPASPLFQQKEPDAEQVRRALATGPIAVSDAQSAAGYIYPLMKVQRSYEGLRPQHIWFTGSEAEVLKHVVSGLAPVGALREGVLAELLPRGRQAEFCRVIWETEPFPTDPILLRRELLPAQSDLGRELKVGLQSFFKHTANSAPRLRLKDVDLRPFQALQEALVMVDGLTPATRAATSFRVPGPMGDLTPTSEGLVRLTPAFPPAETPAFAPALPPEDGLTSPDAAPSDAETTTAPPELRPAMPPGLLDALSDVP